MTTLWLNVKLILGLLFIVFLAYYSIRLLGRKTAGFLRGRAIRTVQVQSLGPGKSLHVLVVDGKSVLILGVSSQVECIARFDEEPLARKLIEEAEQRESGLGIPGGVRAGWSAGLRGLRRPQSSETPFANVLDERLRSIRSSRERIYGSHYADRDADVERRPDKDGRS